MQRQWESVHWLGREMIHSMIAIFQQRAEMLDMQGSKATVDDAIGLLVAWIEANRSNLNEDDLAIFGEIGGTLYRDGLKRRGFKT